LTVWRAILACLTVPARRPFDRRAGLTHPRGHVRTAGSDPAVRRARRVEQRVPFLCPLAQLAFRNRSRRGAGEGARGTGAGGPAPAVCCDGARGAVVCEGTRADACGDSGQTRSSSWTSRSVGPPPTSRSWFARGGAWTVPSRRGRPIGGTSTGSSRPGWMTTACSSSVGG
jgi:hypothetical protein